MTNQEIITKSMDIACANGYRGFDTDYYDFYDSAWYLDNGLEYKDYSEIALRDIIFDHIFAKAFWGERQVKTINGPTSIVIHRGWRYHLQRMVLEEEPLKYLAKFLKG